jgi:intraflagellar transport protein 140
LYVRILTGASQVKLSGKAQDGSITWAGKGLLAVNGGDANVRLWDVDSGDNFVLTLDDAHFRPGTEVVTSVAFSRNKGVLACGTNCGRVAFWKHAPSSSSSGSGDPEASWTPLTPSLLGGPGATSSPGAVVNLCWGTARNLLGANTMKEAFILSEHTLCAHFKDQVRQPFHVAPPQKLLCNLLSSVRSPILGQHRNHLSEAC